MKHNSQFSGIIFNIQKFSIHDGPGIRTTVFFKGCPLRCRWCANPESQLPGIQILWDRRTCAQCHHCVTRCPQGAITTDNMCLHINTTKCTGCSICVHECPTKSLHTAGVSKTMEEILHTCLQDRAFYEESQGGVTLSGGEVLSSPDFAIALLSALQDAGIHTAIETSGYAPTDIFLQILEHVDLLLFDLKHWQAEKHLEGTGVSNTLPLSNLQTACALGKTVLPRIPVIPGYNDQCADAAGFVCRLKEVRATRVQLLPFHQFGQNKYHLLGRTYAYEHIAALHEEELQPFQQIFLDAGIDAFF